MIRILVFSLAFLAATTAQALTDYADLVERLMPAVVNISTKTEAKMPTQSGQVNPFEGTPFEDFFGDFGFQFDGMPSQPEQALGSGVVISEDGYVVTNHHVIDGADEILVKFNEDRDEYPAELIGVDPKNDLALLKLKSRKDGYPYADLGDSDLLRVGEGVLAIGNPFGLGGTVTSGIVSALSRHIGQGPYDDFIQTDAAINPGNSGGPLFNAEGEIIGINTAIYSRGGGSNGIGFAVPINTVKLVVNQIKEHGRPIRGWLGVRIQTVTEDLAASFNLPADIGALVSEVVEDSPADKGGIKNGDVILSFNGTNIEEMPDLPRLVAETPVGKRVPVEIMRQGKKRTLRITIAELEEEDELALSSRNSETSEEKKLGLTAQNLTSDMRKRLKLPKGVDGVVVTAVKGGSAAAKGGLQRGDVIVEAGWKSVSSTAELKKALKSRKKQILLRIYRNDGYLFVPLNLK